MDEILEIAGRIGANHNEILVDDEPAADEEQ